MQLIKMKFTLFVLICFAVNAKGQSPTLTSTIKGIVADSVTKKGLDFITVGLKTEEKILVRSVPTKSDGSFSFPAIKAGSYSLTIIAVGYKPKNVVVNAIVDQNLETIYISEQTTQLNTVVITADKPLITQEVDRIGYDVQADPESKTENVLDMLRKVPMVSIDADDNIQVKGSGNFKVLINGRTSSLVARDPKEVFKSMPASNIQKIEVIITPPAKYDSEGLAGIINIITNKKIDNGHNASVGMRYDFINGPSTNTSFTVKNRKVGFFANGSLNRLQPPSTSYRNFRTGFLPVPSQLIQLGTHQRGGTGGYLNGELSYEIDSLNLLTGSAGFNARGSNYVSSNMTMQQNRSGVIDRSYRLNNDGESRRTGFELDLNYQLGFKRSKEQMLTASYNFNFHGDDQLTLVSAHEKMNYDFSDYYQKNNAGTDEQTIQLDYTHPLKKVNIEGGMKAILRDNYSDYGFESFDRATGEFVINPNRTNNFNYNQNVYSFYNSYQLNLDKWSFKGGLRLERTVIDANFVSSSTRFNTSYNNFIPSVSVQRKLKKMSTLSLGYTQRIQRPGIYQLNPFVDQADPLFSRSGNINLRSALNNNFDLRYSLFKKGSINAGLNYSFANNNIEYVSNFGADTVTRLTFENIGKNKSLGINLNTNYPVTKEVSININSGISYIWREGSVNGKLYKNEGMQGNALISGRYKFEKDWHAGINAAYYSAWINLQNQSNSYYYTSVSLSKDFLKKQASLSVSVNNPFQKFRSWKNETNTPEFTLVSNYQFYYRSVNMSFNYRFGKLKDSIKKNKRGINNDDVSGGKSGGG